VGWIHGAGRRIVTSFGLSIAAIIRRPWVVVGVGETVAGCGCGPRRDKPICLVAQAFEGPVFISTGECHTPPRQAARMAYAARGHGAAIDLGSPLTASLTGIIVSGSPRTRSTIVIVLAHALTGPETPCGPVPRQAGESLDCGMRCGAEPGIHGAGVVALPDGRSRTTRLKIRGGIRAVSSFRTRVKRRRDAVSEWR